MANGNAPFFQRVKSYFIQFITNRLPERRWFDIEILTTTRKHIFSRYVRCRRKNQADN